MRWSPISTRKARGNMRATEQQRRTVLRSPLSGWSTPLEEIPDPVFAGKMLGDGLAVDPTGATLHAPCDGEIIALPESKHAVTLRSGGGAEILMHIGIDTVGLAGEGFKAHVSVGRKVAAGERLITFDLDLIARRAKSLLTPILVMEGCGFTVARRHESREVTAGDVLMELVPVEDARPWSGGLEANETAEVRSVRVALEHGIHARPAAQIASALKGLAGDVDLGVEGRTANARSSVALMKLGVHKGDEVRIRAVGKDARSAIDAVAAVLAGAREAGGPPPAPAARSAGLRQTQAQDPKRTLAQPSTVMAAVAAAAVEVCPGSALPGVAASRGLAVGQAIRFAVREVEVMQAGAGVAGERFQYGA
jgi:phosphotransferase system HPr (HPr) family protein